MNLLQDVTRFFYTFPESFLQLIWIYCVKNTIFEGLSNSKLDSITYDYIIPTAGSDTRIKWPESKTYEIEKSKITATEINFHLTSKEIKYRLVIDFVLVNDRLRLQEETSTPKIYMTY